MSDQRGVVELKHGAGGSAMRELVSKLLAPERPPEAALGPGGVGADALDDGAAIRFGDRWLVLTTDGHVVKPIFFAGGDIGRLAISGVVNDLAMMGATEVLGLTSSVIIEEGFSLESLARIHESMREASREASAFVVTGDTKVMGRGEIDGIVLSTSGVGVTDRVVRDAGLRIGDVVIVTGSIADHGFAVLAARHQLGLEGDLRSDVAPLNGLIRAALAAGGDAVHAMKDPTRGGVTSALTEMAVKARLGIVLDHASIPMTDAARAAADILGIDPLVVANEGKALLGVGASRADAVLAALHAHPLGRRAAIIGRVVDDHPGAVLLDTGFGHRRLFELEGEPLPRIC
ncbi:MAG: hydrogenase expression/formation protein HypE [Labilithrix sp.]|nr:hydrogenase expression/formation protein HypE [Labilithrix sp.]